MNDIAKLVPDIFYDLIARVIPGAALLAIFYYSMPAQAFLSILLKDNLLVFLVFGGYVCGIVLTGISTLIFDIVLVAVLAHFQAEPSTCVAGSELYTRIHAVAKKHPGERAPIWKMASEKVMLENLIAAAILFAIVVASETTIKASAQGFVLWSSPLLVVAWIVRVKFLCRRLQILEEETPEPSAPPLPTTG